MDVALLVGLCILLAIAVGCIVLTYSYFIYTRNRIFSRVKFPVTPVAIISILLICLIIFLVLVAINFGSNPNKYFPSYIGLSSTLVAFCVGYLICFICIYVLNNKNKTDYVDIPNVDWKKKEKELEAKVQDMEDIKAKLSSKDSKYYTTMLQYYKSIVSRLGSNLPISEIIADIVTFNDVFTHKWSTKKNAYQLQLTYKFCMIFQKKSDQK